MSKKSRAITDYPPFLKDLLIAKSPTGHEFAAQALLLASEMGGYITGTAINVDGGRSPVV
jgi:NAD(P)-dependent dehydrogenase (short-subunit alcohol dehydrogenase family)